MDGLAIHDAFACRHCDKVLLSEKKIREHSSLKHKDLPIPGAWRICRAQRFQSGGGQSGHQVFWEIYESDGDSTTSLDSIIQNVLSKIGDELVVPQLPRDDRMISPWLLTTRWHESIGIYPPEALRKMVALPQDGEGLQKLKHSVEIYFETALALIPTTDELTLQKLNSPDPVKSGISNTPFHKHQQQETMQRYLYPIVALLSMLIRSNPAEPYNIPMPDHLEKLLDDLDLSVAQDSHIDEGTITGNIHRIFMCLWQTKWERTDINPIPDPTERCIALLTLQKDGSFKEPQDVTGIIAKDEYCMRLAFLTEIKNRVASGAAEDESAAFHDIEPYITEKTHFTLPRLWWTDTLTWRTMLYKGNRVDLGDVCRMFADTEARLVDAWENSVLKGLQIRINYDDIADDLTNKDVGYSFLSDQRNSCFTRRDRLLDGFLRDNAIFAHFAVVRQGNVIWNQATLRLWLQDYADFHSLLLLRCEMLSGAPGRGTELTAMTYRNTRTRPTRNLVILGKHITMLCLYSKTSAITGRDRMIPHSLDAVTGDILVQDLALARPFAEFAASICFPNNLNVKDLYRQHIFVRFDRLFNSTELSSVMTRHSLPFLDYGLTINSWRHIQTAWKRKFKCSTADIMEEDTQETVEALQAGHSRETENRIYGLSVQALSGAAEDVLPLFLNASTTWQRTCQTSPGGTLLPYTKARASHNDSPPSLGLQSHLDAEIQTHLISATRTEDIVRHVFQNLIPVMNKAIHDAVSDALANLPHIGCALTHRPRPDVVEDREKLWSMSDNQTVETFESNDSHEVQTSDITMTYPEIPVRAHRRFRVHYSLYFLTASHILIVTNDDTSTRLDPDSDHTSDEALQAMKALFQDEAVSWASEQQQQAMTAVLEKQSDVVAILRTGGGKSVLAIIPSIVEKNSVTVLVVPLNSLMIDFERRLKEMGVAFQIYDRNVDNGNLNLRDNLILVTADKCRTDARIVVDEAHMALIARDYRNALDHMYDVRSLPVQIVLLTATMPPSSEAGLKESFNLGHTTIVRQCTNRQELSYILEKLPHDQLIDRVVSIVEQEQVTWQDRDRALVFVTTLDQGQSAAGKLRCPFYHGNHDLMTDEERRTAYQSWVTGVNKIMVATSAFSTGNDYANVRVTIHLDRPYEMLEFIQGQGRAGRDGLRAKCYVLVP
ncbi:P-loop containing nucleoside triphosphate hydrolase protein, partial [Suillus hirtellus]